MIIFISCIRAIAYRQLYIGRYTPTNPFNMVSTISSYAKSYHTISHIHTMQCHEFRRDYCIALKRIPSRCNDYLYFSFVGRVSLPYSTLYIYVCVFTGARKTYWELVKMLNEWRVWKDEKESHIISNKVKIKKYTNNNYFGIHMRYSFISAYIIDGFYAPKWIYIFYLVWFLLDIWYLVFHFSWVFL